MSGIDILLWWALIALCILFAIIEIARYVEDCPPCEFETWALLVVFTVSLLWFIVIPFILSILVYYFIKDPFDRNTENLKNYFTKERKLFNRDKHKGTI